MSFMSKKKKILVIEDDKFLAKTVRRALEHDFDVILATNGIEGLKKALTTKNSLILLDIMLPDIDGFKILEKIKANKTVKKTPVIIMSNLGQTEDIQLGKKMGAAGYLVKSELSLDEILKKVKLTVI